MAYILHVYTVASGSTNVAITIPGTFPSQQVQLCCAIQRTPVVDQGGGNEEIIILSIPRQLDCNHDLIRDSLHEESS